MGGGGLSIDNIQFLTDTRFREFNFVNDANLERNRHQSRPVCGVGNAGYEDLQKPALTSLCAGIHAQSQFNENLVGLRTVVVKRQFEL